MKRTFVLAKNTDINGVTGEMALRGIPWAQ
jgi:hypothetical protein